MSECKVQGQVHVIEESKTFGQKGFRKRLVVLEQDKGRYTNYLPIDFTHDGCDRRQSLWDALSQPKSRSPRPLLDPSDPAVDPLADLPAMTVQEQVVADYQTLGLTLRPHPVSFYREHLQRLGATPAAQLANLPHRRQVRVAGLILLRQRPSTGNGITFATLEDETGTVNLVLYKSIWERFHAIARHSNAWFVRGRLESRHGVIHVVAQHLQDMQHELTHRVPSRDFQ